MSEIDNFDEEHNDKMQPEAFKETYDIGSTLRNERISKNFDQLFIQKNLNIKARIIQAIEEHDYAALPDTVTVTALVRQYARFLGLNGEQLSNAYKTEMQQSQKSDQKIDVVFPDKLPSSFRPFKNSLLLTVILGLIYFVWHTLGDINNILPKIIPASEIIEDMNTKPESSLLPMVTGQENRVSLLIKPEITFTISKKQTILLVAKGGKSWVEIKNKKTDKTIYSSILTDGQSFEIPNDVKGLRLKAGNSTPLSIQINGQSLGLIPKQSRVLRDFNIDSDYLLEYFSKKNANSL